MRIGVVAPPWTPVPPPLYGGTELIVDLLCRGLQAAGHDVVLFTTGDSTCPVPRRWALPEAEGFRMGMSAPEAHHVLAAYADIAELELDVVHDHTIVGPIYAESIPGLRVVGTAHGPFDADLRAFYGYVARRHALVCISHHQRSTAPEVPVAAVIHHGIDASAFRFGQGRGGYALYLGRMARDKGAHRAIEAARKAGVPLKLVAKMREPAERAYFEAEVAPLLSDEVTYLGEVGQDEKIALLSEAIALVNPIRWPEPFGLVMTESLACGTPVVTFAEGAAPEIVEHGRTGFVCADEAEMAEGIIQAATLDRGACRAAVEGYFSVERMVADHVALYQALADGLRPRVK
ncbi:MAG TPA: glycosyltransferase family 4 protein [Acidimicrobiales bacterium]|nr:glycosyltransferase family 4 protein [Acidimicrobiales bacterium]